jgi:hypothetical protein
MAPGSWRMVAFHRPAHGHSVRGSLNDCGRLCWPGMGSHQQHTVQLREEGHQVAAAVRKATVSKRQPARSREHPATEYGSGLHLCQAHQYSADGRGIPLLAPTKGWHPSSVYFPRHSVIADEPSRSDLLNTADNARARMLARLKDQLLWGTSNVIARFCLRPMA